MRKIQRGVDRAPGTPYSCTMKNEAKATRTEDERIVSLLKSMLSTWDSLTDAQRADALAKANRIALR